MTGRRVQRSAQAPGPEGEGGEGWRGGGGGGLQLRAFFPAEGPLL